MGGGDEKAGYRPVLLGLYCGAETLNNITRSRFSTMLGGLIMPSNLQIRPMGTVHYLPSWQSNWLSAYPTTSTFCNPGERDMKKPKCGIHNTHNVRKTAPWYILMRNVVEHFSLWRFKSCSGQAPTVTVDLMRTHWGAPIADWILPGLFHAMIVDDCRHESVLRQH